MRAVGADVDNVLGVFLVEVHRLEPAEQALSVVDVAESYERLSLHFALGNDPVDVTRCVELSDVARFRHHDAELSARDEGEEVNTDDSFLPVRPPPARPHDVTQVDQVPLGGLPRGQVVLLTPIS